MRVFLTGASGYIGKHVALELVSRGHQVVGMARKPSQRTKYSSDVEWCYAELTDVEEYWSELESSDAVVHCAMDYTSSGTENAEVDRNFVARMGAFTGQFVYTGNLFADRAQGNLAEACLDTSEHWRFQTECAVIGSSTRSSVVRLGFVYGCRGGYLWDILSPGTLANISPDKIPKVLWPMIHVKDVARLFAMVLESKESGVFHAFDGVQVLAEEIIEAVRAVYTARGITYSESHDYIQGLLQSSVSTSSNRSLSLGWNPGYASFAKNAEAAYLENQ